jgi:surfeit locus 1 family protein
VTSVIRFLVRPRWIAFHGACVALVVLMANLSAWQFHRLSERRDFNAEVRERSIEPTTDIEEFDLSDPSSVTWRRAGAAGTYLADEQVLVLNRSQNGVAGLNVVTPLQLDDGRVVAVARGFVPLDITPADPPTGRVRVVGVLRESENRRSGQPREAEGELREMFVLDLDRLQEQIDDPLLDVWLAADASDPSDDAAFTPIAPPELSEGPHLSYAIQWIIFSICVIVGWMLAVRRSIRRARSLTSA